MPRLTEHQRLMLPWDPPLAIPAGGAYPAVACLWERAKLLFTRVIRHIGSTAEFSQRGHVRRVHRFELYNWLVPVERIVRSCLITRAITWLLMTVEGRKLLRDSPKMDFPKFSQPVAKPARHKITMPAPGWHTIARPWLPEPEPPPLPPQAASEQDDRPDAMSWSCAFRVLGWKFGDPNPEALSKGGRPSITVFDLDAPIVLRPAEGDDTGDDDLPLAKERPALILARRIEALARVLADPAKAIRTLTRFIARLPKGALEGNMRVHFHPDWFHGHADVGAAARQSNIAIRAYLRTIDPEPGWRS